MTLPEQLRHSIKDTYKNTLNFKGRTGRLDYWLFIGFYAVASLFVYALSALAITEEVGEVIYGIFVFVHFFILIGLQARRLHDTNKSAWWLLIGFIPLIGMIVLLVFYILPSDQGPNRYGNDPNTFESAPGQEVL